MLNVTFIALLSVAAYVAAVLGVRAYINNRRWSRACKAQDALDRMVREQLDTINKN